MRNIALVKFLSQYLSLSLSLSQYLSMARVMVMVAAVLVTGVFSSGVYAATQVSGTMVSKDMASQEIYYGKKLTKAQCLKKRGYVWIESEKRCFKPHRGSH